MLDNDYELLEKQCKAFDTTTLPLIELSFKCNVDCERCKNLDLCDALLEAHSAIEKITKLLHEEARQRRLEIAGI